MEEMFDNPIKKLGKKDVKVKRMKACSNPSCSHTFPERGPKKYCSERCQWTVYNEKNPIMRKKDV